MATFDTPTFETWLRPLRRRAVIAASVRAVVMGVAALAVSGLASALALGPLPHAMMLGAAWTAIVSAAIASAWRPVADIVALRGVGVASLLASTDPRLASAVRSAWQLHASPPAGASLSLVRAHARLVESSLRATRPASIVRYGAATLGLSRRLVVATALAAALAVTSGRARAGLFALTHPLATTRTDAPVASVVQSFDVRVVYPTYLGLDPLRVRSATRVDAPIGSTLEVEVLPRIAARRVDITIGEHRLAASRDGHAFRVALLVSEDAPIGVLVSDGTGRTIRDSERRAVHALVDAAPSVRLLAPETDRTIDDDEVVEVTFAATDDVGVVGADLVITPPDGRERRRPLHGTSSDRGLAGEVAIDAAELGALPGDRVSIRVEARDANDVDGPGVGRSDTRVLTLASDSTRRQDDIADLLALRDAALASLADRIEVEVPEAEDAARARFANGSAQITTLLAAIGRLSFAARIGESARTDAPVYAGMISRLRRLLAAERRALDPNVQPIEARTTADHALRSELEDDVLTLTDMLARARVEDAAAIARELEDLRREIASLLRELTRAPSDEARAALLSAIGRAEQRLAELRARLGAMGSSAPAEFANVTDEETRRTQAALDAMRDGLNAGDLDAAARALTELEQQIDGIARALGEGESSFTNEHFGPRDRALAEAMDVLQGIEAEERELATASGNTRTEAARAALEVMGERGASEARALEGDARNVAEAFDSLGSARLGVSERDERARAQQRMRDVTVALASGDLGEASRMAEEGDAEADQLARDLELESMMFPGHDGATADVARAARDAARRAHELRSAIDRAIPDLSEHLGEGGRRALHDGAARQTAAMESTGRLADQFDHGPDGEALLPDVGGDLRAIRDLMGEARAARDHDDAVRTADDEGEAARRLSDLRQRLEEDAQHRRGDSGAGGARSELGRSVEIPEDHEGPMELRRRLLDAMSEDAPSGYDDAVRRYYEGLLR